MIGTSDECMRECERTPNCNGFRAHAPIGHAASRWAARCEASGCQLFTGTLAAHRTRCLIMDSICASTPTMHTHNAHAQCTYAGAQMCIQAQMCVRSLMAGCPDANAPEKSILRQANPIGRDALCAAMHVESCGAHAAMFDPCSGCSTWGWVPSLLPPSDARAHSTRPTDPRRALPRRAVARRAAPRRAILLPGSVGWQKGLCWALVGLRVARFHSPANYHFFHCLL